MEFVGLMLLHIFNEIFCFRPIFDAPIFKIPFIHVWIAFIIDIKNSPIRNRLGGGVHADAIMDRIIHNSITINAGDVNMREVEAKMNKE